MTDPVDLTREGERDDDGLSPMERKFVEAALDLMQDGEKHWRKKAAVLAGYKEPRNAAYLLIRRPAVIAAISRDLTDAAAEVKVDRSFVLFKALALMTTCEANGDFRTARQYLDIIARHADVGALGGPAAKMNDTGGGGSLSLPLDNLENLSTDDKRALLDLLSRALNRPA